MAGTILGGGGHGFYIMHRIETSYDVWTIWSKPRCSLPLFFVVCRRGWRRGCVDGKLECLYHGLQFDGRGKCVKIPQVNGAMMWWYNISAAVLQAALQVEDRVQGRRQALARLMGIGWSMHAGDGGSPRLSSSPARMRHPTTSSIASHEDRALAAVQVSYTRRPLWSPLEGLELGGSLADDGGLEAGSASKSCPSSAVRSWAKGANSATGSFKDACCWSSLVEKQGESCIVSIVPVW